MAGRCGAGERAWESLGIVLSPPREVDHEGAPDRLRTVPAGLVAARACEMGARTFALQQADLGAPAGFHDEAEVGRPGSFPRIRTSKHGL